MPETTGPNLTGVADPLLITLYICALEWVCDEFCVLLPSADAETARQTVSRIQQRLAQHNLEYPNLPIQLALGAATAEKNNLAEAFKSADRQMYADKSAHKSSANHSPHA
jgi:diguanylate cyclase (GGDEF)-like protein